MTFQRTPGPLAGHARRAEAIAGLVTAIGFASFGVLIGAAAVVDAVGGDRGFHRYGLYIVGGAIVVAAVEATFCYHLYVAVVRRRLDPIIPQFAVRLGRMPWLLRPVATFWWLAHFAAAVGFAFSIEALVAAANAGPFGWAAEAAAFIGVGLTLAFACNLYGLLTLTAAGFDDGVVAAIWRWRFGFELAVAVAAAVAAGAVAGQFGPEPVRRRPPHPRPIVAPSSRPEPSTTRGPTPPLPARLGHDDRPGVR